MQISNESHAAAGGERLVECAADQVHGKARVVGSWGAGHDWNIAQVDRCGWHKERRLAGVALMGTNNGLTLLTTVADNDSDLTGCFKTVLGSDIEPEQNLEF